MAIEKRDSNSHAKLFIPTNSEKSVRAQRDRLKKELEEVKELKSELKELIKDLKEK